MYPRCILDNLQLPPKPKLSKIKNITVEINNRRNGLNSRIYSAEKLADEAEEFIQHICLTSIYLLSARSVPDCPRGSREVLMEFHSRKFSQNGTGRGNSMKRVKEMFESLERSRSTDICLRRGRKERPKQRQDLAS